VLDFGLRSPNCTPTQFIGAVSSTPVQKKLQSKCMFVYFLHPQNSGVMLSLTSVFLSVCVCVSAGGLPLIVRQSNINVKVLNGHEFAERHDFQVKNLDVGAKSISVAIHFLSGHSIFHFRV